MASVFKRGGKRAKGTYYVSYVDQQGRPRSRSARTTDKDAAERIAKKLEADATLRREGVIDPRLDELGVQSRRGIAEHLADFKARMEAAKLSENHVKRTCGFIEDIVKAADFQVAGDIAADAVNHYAAELLGKNKSSRTVQARLTAIKTFTRWLTVEGKLPADPLLSVSKPSPKTDRRRERRMLLPEEWE